MFCRDLVCVLLVIWPSLRPFICNVFDFFYTIDTSMTILVAKHESSFHSSMHIDHTSIAIIFMASCKQVSF